MTALRDQSTSTPDVRNLEGLLCLALREGCIRASHSDTKLQHTWTYDATTGEMTDSEEPPPNDTPSRSDAPTDPTMSITREVLETGAPISREVEIETPAGTRTYRVSAEPSTDTKGSITGVRQVSFEITARKDLKQHERLAQLNEFARELSRAKTREEVCALAVETARETLHLPITAIKFYDEEAGRLEHVARTDEVESLVGDGFIFDSGHSIPWEVYSSGERRVFNDFETESEFAADETPLRSAIILPIEGYGVFVSGSTEPHAFGEAEQQLANIFVANTEAALNRVAREQALRERERILAEQNERLDRFASKLAHELRNPVQIGLGYIDRLPSETPSNIVKTLQKVFHRINSLIDILLTVARGYEEVGQKTQAQLAEQATAAWENVPTETGSLEIQNDRTIYVEPTVFNHLLTSLFTNAVTHGGVDVTITVGTLPDGFFVEDDGVGIPEEKREQVFETGYTTSLKHGGGGLGLAFVNEVVEEHGWTCTLTESESGGARFEFTGVNDTPPPEE